jgi:hypothetical protein
VIAPPFWCRMDDYHVQGGVNSDDLSLALTSEPLNPHVSPSLRCWFGWRQGLPCMLARTCRRRLVPDVRWQYVLGTASFDISLRAMCRLGQLWSYVFFCPPAYIHSELYRNKIQFRHPTSKGDPLRASTSPCRGATTFTCFTFWQNSCTNFGIYRILCISEYKSPNMNIAPPLNFNLRSSNSFI